MTTWMPIETAPRDGSRILIMCARPLIARWESDLWYAACHEGPGWLVFECEDTFYSVFAKPDQATHWMPLPAPPTAIGD